MFGVSTSQTRNAMRKLSIILMAIVAISFMSCNKEKLITLSTTSKTLHHGETYQISAECQNPIAYSSANEYHAKVSSSGFVTAQYVGSTRITLRSEDDTKSFTVTVSPKSNLYSLPNISFGETRNSVVSKLGTPDNTTNGAIAYNNYSSAAQILMVLFDDYDKVEAYGIVVKSSYTTELGDYLGERYDFVGYSNEIFMYRNALTNEKATMLVAMELYNINYWLVAYAPYTSKFNLINNSFISLMKSIEK